MSKIVVQDDALGTGTGLKKRTIFAKDVVKVELTAATISTASATVFINEAGSLRSFGALGGTQANALAEAEYDAIIAVIEAATKEVKITC